MNQTTLQNFEVSLSELYELPVIEEALKVLFPQIPELVFSVDENPECEFPCKIEFWKFPAKDAKIRVEVARLLAEHFNCRSVTDGSGFGDDDSPYWSVVWEGDRAYLADDSNSSYADGEGGDVRIVRPIEFKP